MTRPHRAWLASVAVMLACGGTPDHAAVPAGGGQRVTVEVLNGTRVDGLARRLTSHLRRHGLDVVFFGSAADPADTTRIILRRGDSSAAVRVRNALGTGRIERLPDARLLLDVTVVLGPDAARLNGDP